MSYQNEFTRAKALALEKVIEELVLQSSEWACKLSFSQRFDYLVSLLEERDHLTKKLDTNN